MLDLYYLAVAALDRNTTPRSRRIDLKTEDAFYQNFRESPLQQLLRGVARVKAMGRRSDIPASALPQKADQGPEKGETAALGSPRVAISGCGPVKRHPADDAHSTCQHAQGQAA